MMEDPEHHEPESLHPRSPQFLDYRGAPSDGDKPPITLGRIAIGFFSWNTAVAAGVIAGMMAQSFGLGAVIVIFIFPVFTVYCGNRYGWRGYVPGVLIGAAFTCLVPIGITAVMCGTGAWTFNPH
jgi:hypothetical protein